MIFFPELKAVAKCEASGCAAETLVLIALASNGAFAACAPAWQYIADEAVFHTFCPEHHQELKQPLIQRGLQLGPRGLRPMNGKRG